MASLKIIVAVSGGIAAYKSCELVRLLVQSGATVKVVMTSSAENFIHRNTFAALSNNAVHTDMFTDPMLHIELAKWADRIIIAPSTAATISRIANGLAEDLLTTVCLATEAKCYIAPAMNKIMWQNPATTRNIKTLQQFGYEIIMPSYGAQACGDIGYGRMAEVQSIVDRVCNQESILAGINIIITAGPTHEQIDCVRYIANHSSGKMGYALATACQQLGATVTLITGPTALAAPYGCKIINVISAEQMLQAVHEHIDQNNILIAAAAVADYRPAEYSAKKIKKSSSTLSLQLKKTTDILQSLKGNNSIFKVGFAAESENLITNAMQKLKHKSLDAIVANQVAADGFPFGAEQNIVTYINKSQHCVELEKNTKNILALNLLAMIAKDYAQFQQSLVSA